MKTITLSLRLPTSKSEVTQSLGDLVTASRSVAARGAVESRRLAGTGLVKAATGLLWLNARLAPKK